MEPQKYPPRTFFDISRTLHPEIAVWPGSPALCLDRRASFERDGYQDSNLRLNLHTGTHVDAPRHHLASGADAASLALSDLVGPCLVIDVGTEVARVEVASLKQHLGHDVPARLLIKTRNSFASETVFNPDFVALSEDAAAYLARHGCRLVGVDGPSVQCFGASSQRTHTELLHAGVVIVEGLILTDIAAGHYDCAVLPLKILGGDGAPARAILMRY